MSTSWTAAAWEAARNAAAPARPAGTGVSERAPSAPPSAASEDADVRRQEAAGRARADSRPSGDGAAAGREKRVDEMRVGDVMTNRVLVARPDDDILLAWEIMVQAGIHHLPVVDGTRLVGMLDDRHLAREWMVGPLTRARRDIGELVGDPPVQVHPDQTLREAAALMAVARLDAVCVTDRMGHLVGILTTRDLVDAIAGISRQRAAGDGPSQGPSTTPLLFRLTPVVPFTGGSASHV